MEKKIRLFLASFVIIALECKNNGLTPAHILELDSSKVIFTRYQCELWVNDSDSVVVAWHKVNLQRMLEPVYHIQVALDSNFTETTIIKDFEKPVYDTQVILRELEFELRGAHYFIRVRVECEDYATDWVVTDFYLCPYLVNSLSLDVSGIYDVAVANGYAYISADLKDKIIDVTDPYSLRFVTEINEYSYRVTSKNNIVYILDPLHLKIYDISNASSPVKLSEYVIDTGWISSYSTSLFDLCLKDTLLFIVAIRNFHIVNVKDPAEPVKVFSDTGDTFFESVDVNLPYIYLGEENRVNILDAHDIKNPVLVDTYHYNELRDICYASEHLYIVGYSGLVVLDVSNPASPKEVFEAPINSSRAFVKDNYLYTLRRIFDITEPANPKEVAHGPHFSEDDFDYGDKFLFAQGKYAYGYEGSIFKVYRVK